MMGGPNPEADELAGMLLSLAADCPMGEAETDCPLRPLRDLSLEDRIAYLRALGLSEQRILFFHHHECFTRRKGE